MISLIEIYSATHALCTMHNARLSEIERGECVLDSISEIVDLAGALQIAPSELMRLPLPAPVNGHTGSIMRVWRNDCRRSAPDPGSLSRF